MAISEWIYFLIKRRNMKENQQIAKGDGEGNIRISKT